MKTHSPSDDLERLLTTAEAAAFVGMDVATLQNWRIVGSGPAYVKLGKGNKAPVRYRLNDIIEWHKTLRRVVPSMRQNVEAAAKAARR